MLCLTASMGIHSGDGEGPNAAPRYRTRSASINSSRVVMRPRLVTLSCSHRAVRRVAHCVRQRLNYCSNSGKSIRADKIIAVDQIEPILSA